MNLKIVNNEYEVSIADDPVRKDLDFNFRTTEGRRIYTIPKKSVVCTANTIKLPKTIKQLIKYTKEDTKEFTIFYTLWSYEKGFGRLILNYLLPNLNTKRFVTLSPKTDMAYKFHTKNGATLVSTNRTSYNFEYFR